MKIAVHIPAWKRRGLLEVVLHNLWVIARNLSADDIEVRAFVAGSEGRPLDVVCGWHNAEYVDVPNEPLGSKVNAAVKLASKWSPDVYIGIGSDDLVTSRLFEQAAIFYSHGLDYVGAIDLYCYDLVRDHLVYWPGYVGPREGESIGLGRMVSARVMRSMSYEPFPVERGSGLDAGMTRKIADLSGIRSSVTTTNEIGPIVDIKTDIRINHMPPGDTIRDADTKLRQWFGNDVVDMLERLDPRGEFADRWDGSYDQP